ncbi:G-type lectin S-receptor-like serine/threonine-protein kinase At4g27290 [Bidens hawaiensis]|uniref:G-type lectin S-receptor-like serine/threonine-protein kinase At4g27290 n=1 Tax=Bidens hawaiensis TaxID=980011 RepID=UPI00404A382A
MMNTLLLLKLVCSLIFLNFQTSLSTDTLRCNQSFDDGFTLISSNQRFEFGFFSPSNGSSGDRYLGIWYHNLPLTVVWVANQNFPIHDSFGKVALNENGVLILYNRSLGIVWSTNNIPVASGLTLVLKLLDTGNLVIRDDGRNKTIFWESFDFPTDTLLPDIKLGWKLDVGLQWIIRSWNSSDDPSEGEYLFSLDPPEAPQLVLRSGSRKLFRWGPFDGSSFSGSTVAANPLLKTMFVYNSEEVYFKYEILDESILSRLVISPTGLIQYYTWKVNISKEWNLLVTFNSDPCDNYASCGHYGICYSLSSCKCLSGFTPDSPRDWGLFSYSGGCRRKHELNCGHGDGFVKYDALKLPDNPIVWGDYTNHACEAQCLENCSCMAYANVDVYGNGSKCLVWIGDLVDLKNFPDGGDQQIFIRMGHAELQSIANAKRKRVTVKVVSVISVIGVLLISGGVIWYLGRIVRYRRHDKIGRSSKAHQSGSFRYVEDDQDSGFQLPLYDFETIFLACNNFSERNKIGQGGFGSVYRGALSNGQEIAVKRLVEKSIQGVEELKNEIILIAKLQHRNLVKLLGCCIEGEETMLIYEYLPNKSLNNFIYDKPTRRQLTWIKRYHIIKGIARGLLYLHQDSRLRIIHRDLKTSNILLDSELNPKISDFGIARIFGTDQIQEMTKRIIGTYGYMSPEYAMNGHYSVKSDVYSFGVIVLEIISGYKNWAFHHPDHDLNLLGHAWMLWIRRQPLEILDPVVQDPSYGNQIIRCVHVALLCVQQYPEFRPKMSTVYAMLSYENIDLPEPKEPGFCKESYTKKFDTSTSDSTTANEVTMTTLGGR